MKTVRPVESCTSLPRGHMEKNSCETCGHIPDGKKNVKDDFHMNCPGSGKQNENATKAFSNKKNCDKPCRFREALMEVGLLTFM